MPVSLAAPAPGQQLTGPAVTALDGGAASLGFSLDGGQFSVEPPPAGAEPGITRTEAECEALAAVDTGGQPLIDEDGLAGVAVGYGLVTVSPRLPVNSWRGYYPDIDLPTPAPARYQSRLAWVVVFRTFDRAACPGMTSTTPPSPAGEPYHGYYYEVFIVDSATGGAALLYNEAAPRQCDGPGMLAPSVSIPIELTSVRWQLDSRDPHDYYGTLTAYVPPCEDYDNQVAIAYSGLVQVLAYGQVAASCGPPRPVTVYVEATSVFGNLPKTLAHAATGLDLTGTGPLPSMLFRPTGTIVPVGVNDDGRTISVHVGEVIAPAAFPVNPAHPPLVQSSDPAVLGLLGPPLLQNAHSEFRAWRPGRVTLSADYQGWTVHIIVLAASPASSSAAA